MPVGHFADPPLSVTAKEDDDPRVVMILLGDAELRLLLDGVAVCTYAKLARRETRRREGRRGTH